MNHIPFWQVPFFPLVPLPFCHILLWLGCLSLCWWSRCISSMLLDKPSCRLRPNQNLIFLVHYGGSAQISICWVDTAIHPWCMCHGYFCRHWLYSHIYDQTYSFGQWGFRAPLSAFSDRCCWPLWDCQSKRSQNPCAPACLGSVASFEGFWVRLPLSCSNLRLSSYLYQSYCFQPTFPCAVLLQALWCVCLRCWVRSLALLCFAQPPTQQSPTWFSWCFSASHTLCHIWQR